MPLEESLTCVFQRVDGCVVLRLRGEMDLANAPQVAANLRLLVEDDHVVGDLTGVSFMDSSGLNAMGWAGDLVYVDMRRTDYGVNACRLQAADVKRR